MTPYIYRAIKVTIAVLLAIILAEALGLLYATTAGVIAMLSILDNRKQTFLVGAKRIGMALAAIFLSSAMFYAFGFSLLDLGLFLLIFIPLATALKATEGLVVSTVLVTHIYTLQMVSASIIFNEMALMLLGVLMGFLATAHMPQELNTIRALQQEIENRIRQILKGMAYQLINQCVLEENHGGIEQLDALLDAGLEKAVTYNQNHFLKDDSYYIKYFQMRRHQYLILTHMAISLERIFIASTQAAPLCDFVQTIAVAFGEDNDGKDLYAEGMVLKKTYEKSPLPQSRTEFEDRAVLYQFLTDMLYFLEIKVKFTGSHHE